MLQPGAVLSNLAQQDRQEVRPTLEEDRGHPEFVGSLEIVPGGLPVRRPVDRYDGEVDGPRNRSHYTFLVFASGAKCSLLTRTSGSCERD